MAKEEKAEGEEKNKDAEEGGAPPAKKGKKGFVKLAIMGGGIIVLLGGGFMGWKLFLHKGAGEGAAEAKTEHSANETPGQVIALDPFVVNLADPSETTYLKITVSLEVEPSEEITAELGTKTPQIRDAILMLLTSKTSEDVKDTGGKLQLQDEMVSRINNFLHTGKVKAVYFTEFVMQ